MAACGGGGDDPAPPDATLPDSVQLKVPASAKVDAELVLASQDGVAPGVTYQWTFGDGSSSTERSPRHRYAKAGDYDVTLTLVGGGLRMTASARVAVRQFANVEGTVCSGADASGWCWQRPTPSGNAVAAVAFADASTGWAVGDLGMILKTADGGVSWVPQKSGVESRLTAVAFADAQVGWAIGDNAVVLKTADGGATWLRQVPPPVSDYASYNTLGALKVLSRDIAVISLPNNYYDTRGYVTTDGGANWVPHGGAVAQQVTADGSMWSYNGYDTVQTSPDLGKTWTTSRLPGMASYSYGGRLAAADGQHAVVVALNQKTPGDYWSQVPMVWLTSDGGQTWAQSAPAELSQCSYYWCNSVSDVLLASDGVIWAAVNGALARSTDWGENWSAVSRPADLGSGAVLKAAGGDRITVVSGSTAYVTDDAGVTWHTLRPAQQNAYNDALTQIGTTDPQHYWMLYGERLYVSSDAGTSFSRSLGPAPEDSGTTALASWFFDAHEGIALSSAGWMQRTTDGGLSWTRTAVSVGAYPGSARMQFVSRDLGWLYLGNSGTLLQSTDGGRSWVLASLGAAAAGVRDFHFVSASEGWALDQAGQVFKTVNAGVTWSRLDTAPSVSANLVRFSDADTGVLVIGNRMMHTADGGKTWNMSQTGASGSIQKLQFTSKSDAWALPAYGIPIHSTDGGRTWAPIASQIAQALQYVTFNDMHFLDADHGWLVSSGGLVVATTDGGRNWELQNTGSRADLRSVFFTDRYTGWIFGNNGVILATATGG